MPRLIKGRELTEKQTAMVKDAYIYRWTRDNPRREEAWAGVEKPTIPLISDEEWISARGSRFCRRNRGAENLLTLKRTDGGER